MNREDEVGPGGRDARARETPIATRAAPPRPRRLSRKALIVLAGTGAFALAAALGYSLSRQRANDAAPQQVSLVHRGSDALEGAPRDYGDVAREAAGDIGPPPGSEATGTPAADPAPRLEDPMADEAARRRQAALAARASKLFAAGDGARRVPQAADALQGGEPPPAPALPASGDAGTGAAPDTINRGRVVPPAGPNMLLAGSTIPAALVTGLSSDVPGEVVAQVTEDVFDSVTGRIRLIPQGTRLLGSYDARVRYGQSRALVLWERMIFPDGSSMTLERMHATDGSGAAGLADRIDNHWGGVIRAGLVSSLFGIGTELGSGGSDNDAIADAIRDSSGQTIGRAGDRIVGREMEVQPTIMVRPGARVRVLVSRDLALVPWPPR